MPANALTLNTEQTKKNEKAINELFQNTEKKLKDAIHCVEQIQAVLQQQTISSFIKKESNKPITKEEKAKFNRAKELLTTFHEFVTSLHHQLYHTEEAKNFTDRVHAIDPVSRHNRTSFRNPDELAAAAIIYHLFDKVQTSSYNALFDSLSELETHFEESRKNVSEQLPFGLTKKGAVALGVSNTAGVGSLVLGILFFAGVFAAVVPPFSTAIAITLLAFGGIVLIASIIATCYKVAATRPDAHIRELYNGFKNHIKETSQVTNEIKKQNYTFTDTDSNLSQVDFKPGTHILTPKEKPLIPSHPSAFTRLGEPTEPSSTSASATTAAAAAAAAGAAASSARMYPHPPRAPKSPSTLNEQGILDLVQESRVLYGSHLADRATPVGRESQVSFPSSLATSAAPTWDRRPEILQLIDRVGAEYQRFVPRSSPHASIAAASRSPSPSPARS